MKKRILSIVLAAAMCSGLLSGCGGQSTDSTTAAGSQGAAADSTAAGSTATEDVKDGELLSLKIGVAQQFTTLDPGLSTETVNSYAIQHMYACLYKKLDDGSVVPELAAGEPEVSEDGLTYTIKLKEGLVWSDGEPITANDFVFAVNRNLTYGAENGFVTDKLVR